VHHVGECLVGPFRNRVLEGCAGAGDFEGVAVGENTSMESDTFE